MGTISQRELRNDNASVMRRVEEGDRFIVTRRGVPIAKISPISDEDDLRLVKPSKPVDFTRLRRVRHDESVQEMLNDLRDDR